ncbi:hypothetical protein [Streptomyces sp. NPDC060184]|uniref:hypothetical protein n=1 Tax=Streptomyces sp. NPDC060184 TaxID=3347064 RepID=UPI00364BBDFB
MPSPPDGYRNVPVSAPQPGLHVPDMLHGGPSDGDLLVVDFGELAQAIAEAEEAAVAARDIAERLTSAVDRSGRAPWGDDPALGQTFGSLFAEPRDALVRCARELPEVFRNVAEKLGSASASFHETQRASEEAIFLARTQFDRMPF